MFCISYGILLLVTAERWKLVTEIFSTPLHSVPVDSQIRVLLYYGLCLFLYLKVYISI